MVEVTRSNFNDVFPSIEQAITNSTFIAIDAEFTGLSLGPSNDYSLFDNLHQRYEKLKHRAASFIPCQIGLSTFTKCSNKNSYSVETFVFFLRPSMVGSIDRVFTCQASSMDFLNGYNFDFNKFMQEGIPYLNENEEAKVCQEIRNGTLNLPHEKLQDPRLQQKLDVNLSKTFRRNPEAKIPIPVYTKSHVYFQMNEIRRKYPKYWAYAENGSIFIKMVSTEERKKLEDCKHEEQEKVLDYFLGFTKVFRLLIKHQKPIVGHNFLMDLMLLYQNFHQNLPDSYKIFKEEVHNIFPVIYDTKHIWITGKEFKRFSASSALPALYDLFKKPPDFVNTLYSPAIMPTNCQKYVDGDYVHESGYDAFITGFVFLRICHVLRIEEIHPPDWVKPQTLEQHLNAVSPFVNKVNFPYFKLKFINFGGTDPLPLNWSYLCISPKSWTRTLTQEEMNMRFGSNHTFEFKLINGRRAAIAAVMSVYIRRKILNDFKDDPDILVEEYNFLKHSPYVRATLWLTTLTSMGLLVWIWKSR